MYTRPCSSKHESVMGLMVFLVDWRKRFWMSLRLSLRLGLMLVLLQRRFVDVTGFPTSATVGIVRCLFNFLVLPMCLAQAQGLISEYS